MNHPQINRPYLFIYGQASKICLAPLLTFLTATHVFKEYSIIFLSVGSLDCLLRHNDEYTGRRLPRLLRNDGQKLNISTNSSLHRLYHRLDELDFLVRQTVLRIEVGIRPRAGEVLEGDEAEVPLCYVDG